MTSAVESSEILVCDRCGSDEGKCSHALDTKDYLLQRRETYIVQKKKALNLLAFFLILILATVIYLVGYYNLFGYTRLK
jgi:hypothetical protein